MTDNSQQQPADGSAEPHEPPRRRRRKGKQTLSSTEARTRSLTPEQRLLILDSWQRSKLPAGDFAPLVGVSTGALYKWKRRGRHSLDREEVDTSTQEALIHCKRSVRDTGPTFGLGASVDVRGDVGILSLNYRGTLYANLLRDPDTLRKFAYDGKWIQETVEEHELSLRYERNVGVDTGTRSFVYAEAGVKYAVPNNWLVNAQRGWHRAFGIAEYEDREEIVNPWSSGYFDRIGYPRREAELSWSARAGVGEDRVICESAHARIRLGYELGLYASTDARDAFGAEGAVTASIGHLRKGSSDENVRAYATLRGNSNSGGDTYLGAEVGIDVDLSERVRLRLSSAYLDSYRVRETANPVDPDEFVVSDGIVHTITLSYRF